MSRIGNNHIIIPQGLEIKQLQSKKYLFLFISGFYKKYVVRLPCNFLVYKQQNCLFIKPIKLSKNIKQLWGFYVRYLIALFQSVEVGFTVHLELRGVGFRLKIEKQKIQFYLGYSHIKEFTIPNHIYAKINNKKETELLLFGFNKQELCQTAAQIKLLKVPDLYKGKGIFFFNEVLKLKQGKQVVS